MTTDLAERIERVTEVGEMLMKGYNPNDIAVHLDIPRKDVLQLKRDWESLLQQEAATSLDIKDRVHSVLFEVDKHWNMVIKRAWETVEQADQQGALGSKNQALKIIAAINKDRVSVFQQAGNDENAELVEELNRTQRNHEIIMELLKKIRAEHPEVAELIARELNKIQQGDVEVIEVAQVE